MTGLSLSNTLLLAMSSKFVTRVSIMSAWTFCISTPRRARLPGSGAADEASNEAIKVIASDTVRIALASDLHIGSSVDVAWLSNIVEGINSAKPDIVCLAGDIFDNNLRDIADLDVYGELLGKIESVYGVFAVLGNHDVERVSFRAASSADTRGERGESRTRQFLTDSGITLLEDEMTLIDGRIYIAGRKDASPIGVSGHFRLPVDELIVEWDTSMPLLLIDHQPTDIKKIVGAGVDMLLSGHTHRGQIYPARYITRGMFEVDYGYARRGDTHVIVTSGAGIWGPPVRIGTSSEVAVVDIEFNQ